jgi:hypothetical protein
MKNNRVNIDKDVQSRKSIAASRHTPKREETSKITEPLKDEPKEEIEKEAKAPETSETEDVVSPAPKAKRGARSPEGES